MCGHEPRQIVVRREEDLRDGRARSWYEALDWPVVDRETYAQYPRRWVDCVAPCPHLLDGRGALRLEVAMQYRHDDICGVSSRITGGKRANAFRLYRVDATSFPRN